MHKNEPVFVNFNCLQLQINVSFSSPHHQAVSCIPLQWCWSPTSPPPYPLQPAWGGQAMGEQSSVVAAPRPRARAAPAVRVLSPSPLLTPLALPFL